MQTAIQESEKDATPTLNSAGQDLPVRMLSGAFQMAEVTTGMMELRDGTQQQITGKGQLPSKEAEHMGSDFMIHGTVITTIGMKLHGLQAVKTCPHVQAAAM